MPSFLTNDGVRLNYLDEGEGRPVVLIAGFTAPATSWSLQAPALVARGHRVLSLDRRAHGESEAPAHGYRMARHGADLADFLAELDLADVVLVGGSQGANTIWSYADLFGTARIGAVVTVDQTPKMVNTEDWPHGFYGYTAENLGTLFATGVPQTGRGLPPERKIEKVARLLEVMGLTMADVAAPKPLSPGMLALLLDHAVQDWRDVVARVDVPVLFVAGRESEVWPCEHAEAAAALNAKATFAIVEDSGHAVNVDQPEAFTTLLLDFLTP